MEELKNPVRTTVYLDEEILRRCHILFGEAKVDSFSSFVRKALDCYIDYLVTDQPHSFISEELSKTIRDEVRPIASRLSKGLYRYAVLIDMLCQIIAYQDTEWSAEQLEYVRKFANARVYHTVCSAFTPSTAGATKRIGHICAALTELHSTQHISSMEKAL